MDENIKDLLDRQIVTEIENLDSLESGSKEKSAAVEDLAKLYKLKIEEFKADWEVDDKISRRDAEREAREQEQENHEEEMSRQTTLENSKLEEAKKDRVIRIIIAGVELTVPLIFYGIWMHKGFKFEETGTITSSTFRGLTKFFRPTKK